MALLDCESFDGVDLTSFLTGRWDRIGGTDGTWGFVSGRNGNCFRHTNTFSTSGHYLRYNFAAATNPVIIGFAIKFDDFPTSNENHEIILANASSAANAGLGIQYPTNNIPNYGYIRKTGSGSAYDWLAYGRTCWQYVEMKLDAQNSPNGSFEVKCDTISLFSESSADWLNSSSSARISFGMSKYTTLYIDDFYICDTTGSDNNDFLGPVAIETLYPNGNGNTNQWTGSDADSTDNYLHVDDTTPDDDTSYVEDDTSSNKDLYAHTNLTASNITVIAGVTVSSYVKLDSAGSVNYYHTARSSSSESDSSSITENTTTYKYRSSVFETDPNTSSAWTQSAIDAAEFGVKVA